jgi:hypothetical protein
VTKATDDLEPGQRPTNMQLAGPPAVQVGGKSPSDLVFKSPDGALLRNSNFRHRSFDAAEASAGLAGLTPHDLPTAASLAIPIRWARPF